MTVSPYDMALDVPHLATMNGKEVMLWRGIVSERNTSPFAGAPGSSFWHAMWIGKPDDVLVYREPESIFKDIQPAVVIPEDSCWVPDSWFEPSGKARTVRPDGSWRDEGHISDFEPGGMLAPEPGIKVQRRWSVTIYDWRDED